MPMSAELHLAPDLALAANAIRPEPAPLRLPLALAIAVFLHTGLLLAVIWRHDSALIGVGGRDPNAISVELVIERAPTIEQRAAALASNSFPAPTTAPPPNRPSQLASTDRSPRLDRQPAIAQSAVEPSLAIPEPPRPPPPSPPHTEPPPDTLARLPAPSVVLPTAPPPALAGIAATTDDSADAASDRAAALAPGTVERYTRSVIDALSRSKPRGPRGDARGTVRVRFAISQSGKINNVRVSSSSGDNALDAAALAAVQRVTFPAPPAGMSLAQLTYEIPFRFR